MARNDSPFTPEQLEYLRENFAAKPHTHDWGQIIDDSDGQTLTDLVIDRDTTLDEIESRLDALEADEEGDEEETPAGSDNG